MADPYTEYLKAINKENISKDPYSKFIELSKKQEPIVSDPYADYLRQINLQQQGITPNQGEIGELSVKDPVGFGGALWEGLKSGASLGYLADEEPREDMTMGEMSGMLIGELAGGLLPLGLASTATGGFGAPVAAKAQMARAYSLISKVGKSTKRLKKFGDVKKLKGEKLKSYDKILSKSNEYKKELSFIKKDYVDEITKSGASGKKIRSVLKTPLYTASSGKLGKSKAYQKSVKMVAEKFGFEGANALNRFANSATSFALTGVLRKRGEGPLGELEMADRLSGIPKDAWMGGLFTAAGLPTMLGMKQAGKIEPLALMGLGAYSDYLTGDGDPNMPAEERLLHALTLTGFHYVQQGMSNRYIKDKMYNSLLEMNFSKREANVMIYQNENINAQLKKTRENEGFRYRNKKDKDDWASLIEITPKSDVQKPSMTIQKHSDGSTLTFSGKTLKEAREKLQQRYDRFDYNDPALKNDKRDVKDIDFRNKMIDEVRGEDILRREPEMQSKYESLVNQIKDMEDLKTHERTFDIKKIPSDIVQSGRKRILNYTKDREALNKREGEIIESLQPSDFKSLTKWPEILNWMSPMERGDILFNIQLGKKGFMERLPGSSSQIGKQVIEYIPPTPSEMQKHRNDIGMIKGIKNQRDLQYHIQRIASGRDEGGASPEAFNIVHRGLTLRDKDRQPIGQDVYQPGERIIIPRLSDAKRGNEKSWDNSKVQYADIIDIGKRDKNNPLRGIEYVGIDNQDGNIIRVKTVMLDKNSVDFNKVVELDIRMDGSSRVKQIGDKKLNLFNDWESYVSTLVKNDKQAELFSLPGSKSMLGATTGGGLTTDLHGQFVSKNYGNLKYVSVATPSKKGKGKVSIEKVSSSKPESLIEIPNDIALLTSLGISPENAGKKINLGQLYEIYANSGQREITVNVPSKKLAYQSPESVYYDRFGKYPAVNKKSLERQRNELQAREMERVQEALMFEDILSKNGLKRNSDGTFTNPVTNKKSAPNVTARGARLLLVPKFILESLTPDELITWKRIKDLPPDSRIKESRFIMRAWKKEDVSWIERKWNWFREKELSEDTRAVANNKYTRTIGIEQNFTQPRTATLPKPEEHFFEYVTKLTGDYERLITKEQKIREGQFQEINLSKIESNPELIELNKSGSNEYISRFSNSKSLTEGETSPFFFKPELLSRERGSTKQPKPVEPSRFGLRENEYIFEDTFEARRAVERDWQSLTESPKIFDNKIGNLKRQRDQYKTSEDFRMFEDKKRQVKNSLNQQGYTAQDKIQLIKSLYPASAAGRAGIDTYLGKLTTKELSRVERLINGKESKLIHDVNVLTVHPDNYSQVQNKIAGVKLWPNVVREYALSTAAYFEPLGYIGQKIARKLERFSMWRTGVMGDVVRFEKFMNQNLKKYDKELNLSKVNEYAQILLDEKYAPQRQSKKFKETIEKLESIEVSPKTFTTPAVNLRQFIENSYRRFFDDMSKALISSNSWVRTMNPKTGATNNKRFIELLDKSGNRIRLEKISVNPELHMNQVDSFLAFIKDKSIKTVLSNKLDNKGNPIPVEVKKHSSFYQPNYSPRQISDRFMEIAGVGNNKIEIAINNLKKELKDLPVTESRKEEIARQQFVEIMSMKDPQGVYGKQWGRVAELPTHYYLKMREGKFSWDKDNMEVIQLPNNNKNVTKANGELYKKGEKITDSRNREAIIEEVVPVYETDYNKVLKKYADGVSHSTATAHTYGTEHTPNILWSGLVNDLTKVTGDKRYGQFAEKVLMNQLYGESRTRFDTIFRPIARVSALTGLSSPVSSIKNLMLGTGVQNWSVYTTKELMQNMRHLLSKDMYRSEKNIAQASGFTHIGSYDLFLAKQPFRGAGWLRKIAENAGGMQTTEAFNRVFSSSLGMFGLKNDIQNMAGIKNPTNTGSVSASRRRLMDVFKYSPEEINRMVTRQKEAASKGEVMQFTASEQQKARYRSQLVTQGSGDIPYVPYWMGKSAAKPLTLFYRVAYRMTETTQNNVIKPIVVDGNMIPAMKYMTSVMGTGFALYTFYDWVLGEERTNQFKTTPNHMLDYFLKAEGLGLFSNAFNEYGPVVESYQPVVFRNTKTFIDMLVNMTSEGLRGEVGFAGKELKDGMTEIVAAYNVYERLWKNLTGDTQKQFKDSRRRQTQFLDAFYPKEKHNLDYDDGTTSKTAYYRALRDSFWIEDKQQRAKTYYAALHYLTHTIMAEQGYSAPKAKKEARDRLKRVVTRMRPIPTSWKKTPGRTKNSKYNEYYSRLSDEEKAQEDGLDSLWVQRRQDLMQSVQQYKNLYDTESY